jgi:cysteine synthase
MPIYLSFVGVTHVVAAIIMPDDVAKEKVKALHALGADIQLVRPASIVDKKQVCHSIHPLSLSQ